MVNETRYFVSYIVHADTVTRQESFGSALERALFIISLSAYVDIVRQWEAL